MQSSGETRSIARLSQKAVTSLSALSAEPAPGAEAPFTIDGEIERYDIWRAQHDVDDGKLDRLKETSVLRARVISLLDDLCGTIICHPSSPDTADHQTQIFTLTRHKIQNILMTLDTEQQILFHFHDLSIFASENMAMVNPTWRQPHRASIPTFPSRILCLKHL